MGWYMAIVAIVMTTVTWPIKKEEIEKYKREQQVIGNIPNSNKLLADLHSIHQEEYIPTKRITVSFFLWQGLYIEKINGEIVRCFINYGFTLYDNKTIRVWKLR